jgi:hypothetical protein
MKMKTLQRISGTFVRHNWKAVTKGLVEGKTFLVENHGKREAVVMSPEAVDSPKRGGFDLDAYFKRLKQRPVISLSKINASLVRSPEL